MLADLLGALVGGELGSRLGDRWARRRRARLSCSGRTRCGLRVVGGNHPGLSRRWRHGTARLGPGSIRLRGTDVAVAAVDESQTWRPRGRQGWSLSGAAVVVRVRTSDGALLEWALLEPWREWAVQTVRPATERG